VLISVVIDCVVVLSCGLTPLQCTTLDITKLAKPFHCLILPSPIIVKLLLLDYLALPDYLIVKVRGGWPARLDSPDFVLQVWAEH